MLHLTDCPSVRGGQVNSAYYYYYKSIIPLRRPLLKVIKDRSIKDLHYWMLQTRVCVLCSTVLSEIPREVYM